MTFLKSLMFYIILKRSHQLQSRKQLQINHQEEKEEEEKEEKEEEQQTNKKQHFLSRIVTVGLR